MKRRIYASSDSQPKDFVHLMNMYGLQYDSFRNKYTSSYVDEITDSKMTIDVINCSTSYRVDVRDNTLSGVTCCKSMSLLEVPDLISYLDVLMSRHHQKIMSACSMYDTKGREQVILAAISTRDLSKNLVRVKSSNVWAYTINVKDRKSKTGDVLCQFKGKNGGPGDIYIYYDVPVKLWKKWLSAPSKGHFFWAYIRNNFYYSKLTGDKRGKLQNAIN